MQFSRINSSRMYFPTEVAGFSFIKKSTYSSFCVISLMPKSLTSLFHSHLYQQRLWDPRNCKLCLWAGREAESPSRPLACGQVVNVQGRHFTFNVMSWGGGGSLVQSNPWMSFRHLVYLQIHPLGTLSWRWSLVGFGGEKHGTSDTGHKNT